MASSEDTTTGEEPERTFRPGECRGGCGADYPYCDCWRDDDREAEAEAREGMYTAWEIIGG